MDLIKHRENVKNKIEERTFTLIQKISLQRYASSYFG